MVPLPTSVSAIDGAAKPIVAVPEKAAASLFNVRRLALRLLKINI